MYAFVLPLLFGAPQAGEGGAAGGIVSFLPFVLIIAIFYFLIIRPQNKKQKETQKMLEALKKGDKVITIGGVHGTISNVKEKTIVVKVDDNTKIEFTRSAIATVTDSSKEAESSKEEAPQEKVEDKSGENKEEEKKD